VAPDPLASLLADIDPTDVGDDRFTVTVSETDRPILFGGVVAAQSLRVAYRTVDPVRRAQSVHAYFLRPGQSDVPIDLEVQRDTDGRSFSARRVAALQEGKPIFTMVCSFHVPEDAPEELLPLPGGLGPPEDAPHREGPGFEAFDIRDLPSDGPTQLWVRTVGDLPADAVVHDCLLLYVSDMGTPWFRAAPAGTQVGPSLDHALWFHRRARLDEWHHLQLVAQTASDARGVYVGRIWNAAGDQVATVAQENLLRRS
jgi:acyl-CoA thioesterase-2